jgi:hypothetical protein
MTIAEASQVRQASMQSWPPSWFGSMPSGLTTQRKVAPGMMPSVSRAPYRRERLLISSMAAISSMMATARRKGCS